MSNPESQVPPVAPLCSPLLLPQPEDSVISNSSSQSGPEIFEAERTTKEFDGEFLHACKLARFDSRRMKASNLELLFRLTRLFGPGITKAQFRQIMRQCVHCSNVVFVDRRHLHRCNGPVPLTQADGFDLVASLCSISEHAGLSLFDLQRLFTRCGACKHVCLEGMINLHDCPVLGSRY